MHKNTIYNFTGRLLKTLFLAVMFLAATSVSGTRLVVRNFKLEPNDQTAINPASMVKDQNGKTAALIKLYIPGINPDETYFDNGIMGIAKRVNNPGEIWLYIPERSQEMRVSNKRYEPYQWFFEEAIESGRTYTALLIAEGKDIILSASIPGAPLYVDDEPVGPSPQTVYIPYGEHYIKAEQMPMLGKLTVVVTPESQNRYEIPMEDENLKYSDVTITSPDGAAIWFEGKDQGVGGFKTRLTTGDYTVEFRKENFETGLVHFHAQAGTPTIVNGPKLEPYRGQLNIVVNPTTGTKILSGDTIVAMHHLDRRFSVGNHTFTFSKKGYIEQTKTFSVLRNEQTNDTVTLQRIQFVRPNTIYAGVGVGYGTGLGVGVHVGANFHNINAEFGYTLGLSKGDEVYWFEKTGDQLYEGNCAYAVDDIEFKLGYQLSFVQRIGITPQLGYIGQRLRSGEWGNGAMCHNLSIGARLVFNPIKEFGVFVNPEYAVPVTVNDLYKSINEFGGPGKGGFNVRAGVEFNFGF